MEQLLGSCNIMFRWDENEKKQTKKKKKKKKQCITKTCPYNIQIFSDVKIEKLTRKKFDIFNNFQNIHCGYTLEPPRGSNEYPQCMFWIKSKKIRYTPANPNISL